MRIVAGRLKGMKLTDKVSESTRPTSDKLREAIFSMLYSRVDLEEAFVADLYAGTGALGLEAFSRGAQHVVFVETDKRAINAINENIEESKKYVDITNETFEVQRTPVLTFVKNDGKYGTYDVVFADPPYAYDIETEVLSIVAKGGMLVYETSSEQLEICEKILFSHELVKEILVSKKFGSSAVVIAQVV